MTLHQDPLSEVLPAASSKPPGRGPWGWQRLAQRAWIVLALMLLAYFVASIPVAYQSLRTICTLPNPVQCSNAQLTSGNVQALTKLNLSITTYAGLLLALDVAASLLFCVVGVLIFWRKLQEWRGLFFSLLLMLFGAAGQQAGFIAGISVTAQTPLLLQLLVIVSRGTGTV